jgi:3-phenylpropionate/trans-cinnamate dioxygenase ferredoxin subunit
MADFVSVARADDIPDGEMRAFNVEGEEIAIANAGGSFYAFSDVCTHKECSLSDGDLDETIVECPCHGSAFDIGTGEVMNPPATEPIATYEISEEDGVLKVEI